MPAIHARLLRRKEQLSVIGVINLAFATNKHIERRQLVAFGRLAMVIEVIAVVGGREQPQVLPAATSCCLTYARDWGFGYYSKIYALPDMRRGTI